MSRFSNLLCRMQFLWRRRSSPCRACYWHDCLMPTRIYGLKGSPFQASHSYAWDLNLECVDVARSDSLDRDTRFGLFQRDPRFEILSHTTTIRNASDRQPDPVGERRAFKVCSNRHVLPLWTKQLPSGWRIGKLVVAQSDTGDGKLATSASTATVITRMARVPTGYPILCRWYDILTVISRNGLRCYKLQHRNAYSSIDVFHVLDTVLSKVIHVRPCSRLLLH